MVRVKLLWICLIVIESIAGNPIGKNFTLELVQVVFRHGTRTPIECEAKLIADNEESNYEPWRYSQLTNKGMMEEYKIGQMLRNRYKHYLPDSYRPDDLYAYSSAYDRTKASLQLLLAALYPPADDLAWHNDLNWIPVPIHSNPRLLDILMKPRDCPRFIDHLNLLYNSSEFKDKALEHNEILLMLRGLYGDDFKFSEIICAYNLILIHKALKLKLPDWYTDEIFTRITKAAKFYLDTLSYTPVLNRLNGGTLTRKFAENMGPTSRRRKMYLYSGHDKTLYAFAKAHNLTLKTF